MNYLKIYNDIIKKAISENRKKGNCKYYELHHITPRCLGGSNKKENLVHLTGKEHWLVHLLLIEIYPENIRLKLSIRKMMKKSNNQDRPIITSGRQFERLKKMISKAHGDLLRGKKRKPFSDEHKKNISKKMFGNHNKKGYICSEEQKKRIGLSSKGRNCGDKNHMRKTEFREYMKKNNPMHRPENKNIFKDSKNPNAKKVKVVKSNKTYSTIKECRIDLGLTRHGFEKMIKNKDIIYD